jgi:hypothetical protein
MAIMRKLYENFHILHFQKRIVSAETIRENMVKLNATQNSYKKYKKFRNSKLPIWSKPDQTSDLQARAQHRTVL